MRVFYTWRSGIHNHITFYMNDETPYTLSYLTSQDFYRIWLRTNPTLIMPKDEDFLLKTMIDSYPNAKFR